MPPVSNCLSSIDVNPLTQSVYDCRREVCALGESCTAAVIAQFDSRSGHRRMQQAENEANAAVVEFLNLQLREARQSRVSFIFLWIGLLLTILVRKDLGTKDTVQCAIHGFQLVLCPASLQILTISCPISVPYFGILF